MNIYQGCIIDLLEKNGFIAEYVDSHQIGSVTYYFLGTGGLSLKFTNSCLPADIAIEYLKIFSLEASIEQIQGEACHCNW